MLKKSLGEIGSCPTSLTSLICLTSLILVLLCSCCKKSETPVVTEETKCQQRITAIHQEMAPLAKKMMEAENAARANNPDIKKLYDEMTAKRKDYEAQLNETPEMKALHEQMLAKQAELGALMEQQHAARNQETKP